MKKKEVKKIKEITTILKSNNNYKEYKALFKNKQIRFIFTKLSIIFESTISNNYLTNIETSLFNNPTEENFIHRLEEMAQTFNNKFHNLKWNDLGITIWYSFQTSLFYNKKRKVECVFNKNNYLELNYIKKKKFVKWLESFYDTENIDFNKYVIKVLERIT